MFKVLNLEHSNEWDNIVRSFKKYDVYWLSGYVKAFNKHGDGEPLLFYYEEKNSRAINVVMKRDISDDPNFLEVLPKGQYFDLTTPYGYGGWIIEAEDTTKIFTLYEEWCKKNNIVSEFVRYHPIIKNYEYTKNYYNTTFIGKTVAIDLNSPETIFENMTGKNRNCIRKAKKNGIKVYNGRFPEIYEKFQLIYKETMDKNNADSYYYFNEDFFQSLCEDLPYNSQIFYATLEDKIIAGAIILVSNCKMNYHLSGSLKEYGKYAPMNLILHEVALWGNSNGYETFHLGGGVGGHQDGLFHFKKSFYRLDELPNFYIGTKIFDHKMNDELLKIRGNSVLDNSFFPQYRA